MDTMAYASVSEQLLFLLCAWSHYLATTVAYQRSVINWNTSHSNRHHGEDPICVSLSVRLPGCTLCILSCPSDHITEYKLEREEKLFLHSHSLWSRSRSPRGWLEFLTGERIPLEETVFQTWGLAHCLLRRRLEASRQLVTNRPHPGASSTYPNNGILVLSGRNIQAYAFANCQLHKG